MNIKRVFIFFLLITGFSKVFSQQTLDQDPANLNSQKRSQVNALAKIIVDEDGTITIEHIKNSQTKELSEDAEGNKSALKQMDPNSKSENETNSRAEIKSVDKYPTEFESTPNKIEITIRIDIYECIPASTCRAPKTSCNDLTTAVKDSRTIIDKDVVSISEI